MTDKQKIFEILSNYTKKHNISASSVILEEYADELLANGVILPPCKVGDKIYRIIGGDFATWEIVRIEIYEDESGFIDDSDNWYSFEDIGKTVFLTKEEAEEKLTELKTKE